MAAAARIAAGSAIARIVAHVDAGAVAHHAIAVATADTVATGLTGLALNAASTAVGVTSCHVRANGIRAAQHAAGVADALSGVAHATAGARNSAAAAVRRIGVRIDARARAVELSRGAPGGAGAVRTDETGRARDAAHSAVSGIAGRVDTDATAVGGARGARAGALLAGLTAGADAAAQAAVHRIGLHVHAGAAAARERRAVRRADANAVHAELAGVAGVVARSAVVGARARVDTTAGAELRSEIAGANALNACLRRRARRRAGAAMVVGGLQIDAATAAIDEWTLAL